MNQPKVYADITFIINFAMDFMILWATAKLSEKTILTSRLIIASIFGGIYGVLNLFPAVSVLYSLPAKLLFSCLLIIVAFGTREWKDFRKIVLFFYGVSFIMAGATMGVSFLLNNTPGRSFSYWWLLGGITCAWGLGSYGEKYLSQKIIPGLLKYPVELHFGNTVCHGEGFLDTGNGLRDPLTERPVVVAEYDFLQEYFPDDCRLAMENVRDDNDILQELSSSSWANRIRVIPFSSIGQKNGLMIGLRCDQIIIDPDKKHYLYKNVVVGIYLHKLSARENYQLLIPSEFISKI